MARPRELSDRTILILEIATGVVALSVIVLLVAAIFVIRQ